MRTTDDLLSLATYCRDRVNAQMFVYSLSVALLHRPDTKHLAIPQLTEVFPDKYIDSSVFHQAKEEANVIPPGSRVRRIHTIILRSSVQLQYVEFNIFFGPFFYIRMEK